MLNGKMHVSYGISWADAVERADILMPGNMRDKHYYGEEMSGFAERRTSGHAELEFMMLAFGEVQDALTKGFRHGTARELLAWPRDGFTSDEKNLSFIALGNTDEDGCNLSMDFNGYSTIGIGDGWGWSVGPCSLKDRKNLKYLLVREVIG